MTMGWGIPLQPQHSDSLKSGKSLGLCRDPEKTAHLLRQLPRVSSELAKMLMMMMLMLLLMMMIPTMALIPSVTTWVPSTSLQQGSNLSLHDSSIHGFVMVRWQHQAGHGNYTLHARVGHQQWQTYNLHRGRAYIPFVPGQSITAAICRTEEVDQLEAARIDHNGEMDELEELEEEVEVVVGEMDELEATRIDHNGEMDELEELEEEVEVVAGEMDQLEATRIDHSEEEVENEQMMAVADLNCVNREIYGDDVHVEELPCEEMVTWEPPGVSGTEARNVRCVWPLTSEFVLCTWLPGHTEVDGAAFTLSFWTSPDQKWSEAGNCTVDGGPGERGPLRASCLLPEVADECHGVSLLVSSSDARVRPLYITLLPSEIVKYPTPRNLSRVEDANGAFLEWAPPDLESNSRRVGACVKYNVCITSDGHTRCSLSEELRFRIDDLGDKTEHCASVQACECVTADPDACQLPSDWQHILIPAMNTMEVSLEEQQQLLLLPVISIVPLIIFFLVLLLIVKFRWTIKARIWPPIPIPSDLLRDCPLSKDNLLQPTQATGHVGAEVADSIEIVSEVTSEVTSEVMSESDGEAEGARRPLVRAAGPACPSGHESPSANGEVASSPAVAGGAGYCTLQSDVVRSG